MSDSEMVIQFSDQVTSLITKKVIIRAKNMIQKYNGETDAILLSEGLKQTREMLLVMMDADLAPGTLEAELIIDSFRIRWLEMDQILSRARGKRPIPVWTDRDKRTYAEIKALVRELFGDTLPVGNVVPMLLEANHE